MEDAPGRYTSGDVVWVKLGSAWWPGEVTDTETVPQEILANLKRAPLVIVKFFDEEKYEYVKNWGHIYPYNCDKKVEFIKKGMASFRKVAHMGKFPKDVSLAEVKTGGNANILSDPMFLPEQKRTSIAELYTPSPKKKSKLPLSSIKSKPSTSKPIDTSHITHRRFLGFDDYEAFICIQYPGKDKEGESEDEEVRIINNEPEEDYNCHSCPFKTRRLEVMIRHTRSHIHGNYMESPKARRYRISLTKKQRRPKRPVTGDDSLSDTDESDGEYNSSVDVAKESKEIKLEERKVERTYVRKPRKQRAVEEIVEPESDAENKGGNKKGENVVDIRNNLLAEWEDSEEETEKEEEPEKDEDLGDSDKKIPEKIDEESPDQTLRDDEEKSPDKTSKDDEEKSPDESSKDDEEKSPDETSKDDEEKSPEEQSTRDQIKSCFDFEEEEEEEIVTPSTTGRKIPRVIPEKRKSLEQQPAAEEDINKDAILKESESFNRESASNEVDLEFESLMESTAVPELPEIQNALKPEQNFHDTKTIKFPDKEEEPKIDKKESEVATKLTNPKKRFVKSFEDFELEMRRKEELENAARNERNYEETSPKAVEVGAAADDSFEAVASPKAVVEDSSVQSEERKEETSESQSESFESKSDEAVEEMPVTAETAIIKDDTPIDIEDIPSRQIEESAIIPEQVPIIQTVEEIQTLEEIPRKNEAETPPELPKEHNKQTEENAKQTIEEKHEELLNVIEEFVEEEKVEDTIQKHPKFRSKRLRESRRKSEIEKQEEPIKIEELSFYEFSKRRRGRPPKKDKRSFKNDDEPEEQLNLEELPLDFGDKSNNLVESEKSTFSEDITPLKKQKRIRSLSSPQMEEISSPVVDPPSQFLDVKKEESKLITPPKKKRRHRSYREEAVDEIQQPDNSVPLAVAEETPVLLEAPEVVPEPLISTPTEDISLESDQQTLVVSEEVSSDSKDLPAEEETSVSADETHEEPHKIEAIAKEETQKENDSAKLCEETVVTEEPTLVTEETLVIKDTTSFTEETEVTDAVGVVTDEIQGVTVETPITTEEIPMATGETEVGSEEAQVETEETPVVPKEPQVTTEETQAMCEEAQLMSEETQVTSEKIQATGEETQVISEETQLITDQIQVTNEETLAANKEPDATTEKAQEITEETQVITESPIVTEEIPVILEDIPLPTEEMPKVRPLVTEGEPLVEEIPLPTEEMPKVRPLVTEGAPLVEEIPLPTEEMPKVRPLVTEGAPLVEEIPLPTEEMPKVRPLVTEGAPLVEETPKVIEEVSPQIKNIISEVVEEPLVIEEPVVIEETPAVVEETTIIEETPVVTDETTTAAEEFPLITEEISTEATAANVQEKNEEKEGSVSAEECTQQSSDMNEEVSSMDSFKDEFSSIGNASLELPEDAIWSPPKKSRSKRLKPSEDNMMDMFFNFDRKPKRSKPDEEIKPEEQPKEEERKDVSEDNNVETPMEETPVSNGPREEVEHKNEMEVKVGNNGEEEDFKFCIQTNLTNFSKAEEMSALTLAALSEIQEEKKVVEEKPKVEEKQQSMLPEPEIRSIPIPISDSELVQIEGNLTVVTEKDLAEGQVEITTEKVISPKKSKETIGGDVKESTASGTEIPKKAMTIAIEKPTIEKQKKNAYGRLELLDILEGNSNSNSSSSEQTFKDSYNAYEKKNIVQGICDFEECIPSQIVCTKKTDTPTIEQMKRGKARIVSNKLLERIHEPKIVAKPKITIQSDIKVAEGIAKLMTSPATPKTTVIKTSSKFIIKTTKPGPASSGKPIILSEQIIKPAGDPQKVAKSLKQTMDDIEDVEAFVIHKGMKSVKPDTMISDVKQLSKSGMGKAKILNQTIITPDGEIIQPNQAVDDNVFDINSMPIVLSDEILTPESIENMPIVLEGEKVSQPNVSTTITLSSGRKHVTLAEGKGQKRPRLLQSGNKIIKTSPLVPLPSKSAKYIIVPSTPATTLPQGKILTPKAVVKRGSGGVPNKLVNVTPVSEPVGNKIMIVTNQQGQQQRLLLTPAQQKLLQLQSQAPKTPAAAKAAAKTQKTPIGDESQHKAATPSKAVLKQPIQGKNLPLEDQPGPSGVALRTAPTILAGGKPNTLTPITIKEKILTKTPVARKPAQKLVPPKTQKTILIKNQHGETVRKIQGTDDADLDKQVAEQLEAIRASARLNAQKAVQESVTSKRTPAIRKPATYIRKSVPPHSAQPEVKLRTPLKLETAAPPLAPISQKKPEAPKSATQPQTVVTQPVEAKTAASAGAEQKLGRPLNQLVIQDAMGVQTTITEGQIVAFPSETVDGQPQSYMLVTLDEHGNLTPLNNEALMSLDPSLGLGVDLNNMVLQIDQGQGALAIVNPDATIKKTSPMKEILDVEKKVPQEEAPPQVKVPEERQSPAVESDQQTVDAVSVAETAAAGGQQLILTGDPVATQKFLESLSDGSTDLANILANADGGNIIIHADGQQILINTNAADNQLVIADGSQATTTGGNPIFAGKSQDILAAALADTDVFQPEGQQPHKSQLSPNSGLYPMNVGNVLETSLTLSSPIMTPLEVPSTNSKKIDDEADILNQVPKNVDLPITITDPNIAQTVAQQQVVGLMPNEIANNLELSLPISEGVVTTSELTSPYVYSLPTLDEGVDLSQKPFNNSMPLLTEDVVEEVSTEDKKTEEEEKRRLEEYRIQLKSMELDTATSESSKPSKLKSSRFIDEGLCTLGGEMCSSLSEPPPDMFDLSGFGKEPSAEKDEEEASSDLSSAQGETSSVNSSEGSCEIPVQPRIVAKLSELREGDDDDEEKRCKFD